MDPASPQHPSRVLLHISDWMGYPESWFERFGKATIKDFFELDWNAYNKNFEEGFLEYAAQDEKICSDNSNDGQQHRLDGAIVHPHHFEKAWSFITTTIVYQMEAHFKNQVYFTEDQLAEIFERTEKKFRSEIKSQNFPAVFETCVEKKMLDLLTQYTTRNSTIHRYETEAVTQVMKVAVRSYTDQIQALLSHASEFQIDAGSLQKFHEALQANVVRTFDEVCGLKKDPFKTQHQNDLVRQLGQVYATAHQRREWWELQLKFKLDFLKKFQTYHTHHSKTGHHHDTSHHDDHDLRFRALNSFDRKFAPHPQPQWADLRRDFSEFIDKYYPAHSSQSQPAKIPTNEQPQPLFVEPMEVDMEPVEALQCDPHNSGQTPTPDPDPDPSPPVPKLSGEGTSFELPKPNFSIDHLPDHRSRGKEEHTMVTTEPTRIAFHVESHRIKMGIMDGVDGFQVTEDVPNLLYFRSPNLIAHHGCEVRAMGRKFSFVGLLTKNEVDRKYTPKALRGSRHFRIDELISFVLAKLKWRAELKLRKVLRSCVIVVPHHLTPEQLAAVRNAAELARFASIELISDTASIALNFVFKNNVEDGGYLATANLFGHFINVALFQVGRVNRDSGLVEYLWSSGDFFRSSDSNFTSCLCGLLHVPKALETRVLESFQKMPAHGGLPTKLVLACPTHKLRSVKKKLGKAPVHFITIDSVQASYALEGAGLLISMGTLQEPQKFCTRWQGQLSQFKESLSPMASPDFGNLPSSRGQALSVEELEEIRENYFLRPEAQLHDIKMTLMGALSELELRLQAAFTMVENRRQVFQSQITQFCRRIRTLETSQICHLTSDLNAFYGVFDPIVAQSASEMYGTPV